MKNRRLMSLFAILLSLIFAIFYYFLFTLTLSTASTEKRILYMNQVGLYEKQESVEKMIDSLTKVGIESYALKQGKLTAVVCNIHAKEKQMKENQNKLQKLNYSYVVKKVTVEDAQIVKLIDTKQYAKALERIGK